MFSTMKILHVIYTEGVSGAEKHLLNLLPGMKHRGYECELLLICPADKKEKFTAMITKLNEHQVPVHIINASGSITLTALLKLKHFIRKNKILTVHSHLLRTDLLLSLVKQLFCRRLFIISTKHGYHEQVQENYSVEHFVVKKDLYFYLTRFTLKMINENISISKCISQLFLNLQLTKEYFYVIPHGLDIFPKKESKASFKKGSPQLLIVGRLEKYKGHSYMLDALPEILKSFPETKLVLLGTGAYRDELEIKIKEAGTQKAVIFEGFQSDAASYFAASDIIAVPSVFEPFGLVFIEAMALHTPIVSFDVPAGNEFLKHNENAMLANKFESADLARNIKILLSSPEERERIAENAYNYYLHNFTAEKMVNNTVEFYMKILKV